MNQKYMGRIYKIIGFAAILLFIHLPVYGQSNYPSYEAGFQAGLDLFNKGLYEAAIPLLDESSRQSENQLVAETASYFLARALYYTDDERADDAIDRFVQVYPESNRSARLLRDIAERQIEQGLLDEAIGRMDTALKYPQSYNDRAELYFRLGEVSVENQDYDLARAYYLALSDEHRRSVWSPQALFARGRLFLEEERYSDATDAFELLRERHPQNPMTRRIGTALGESYYQQRKFYEAIDAFNEALPHLDEENRTKTYYLIAESYNALNNYAEATQYYREYLRRIDNEEDARIAHYGLGWVFHKQEIYHWASRSFADASAGDDEIARKALYYQAVNLKMFGNYREALDIFREFGQRFPEWEGEFFEVAHFEWAVAAFEFGYYDEAIEVLMPLAREYERLERPAETLTFLGEVFYANNEFTQAIQSFDLAGQIADLDPALKRQARFQRAWVMYFNQAYEQAQPDFRSVYDEAPGTELGQEALFWSADANYQIGRYDRAAVEFSQFVNNYPDHEMVGAAKYSLGWTFFLMGDFENATGSLIDFLNNYEPPSIALYPYDVDTKLRIGDAFFAQGKYNEALEYYMDTVGAEPGGDYAMYQVANSYYRMNRNFEAVTQFRRLLRIYPYSRLREQAQYNIAYVYLNTGNYDQAIEEFTTVIQRYPGTEWAARSQYNIGDSYYNAGQYDEAIAAYQKVLDEYPRSNYIIEAIDGIQYAQLSAGEGDSSTDRLEEFLADNPTSTTADRLRFRQAENVFQSGNYEAAVEEFRQYLRITNNREMMPEAYYNMADAYTRLGRKEEAAEAYETLINEFPSSERAASALVELGRIKQEMGDYDSSLRHFSQLIETDDRFEQEAHLGMGNAELSRGATDRAREHFNDALEVNPDNHAAQVGLGKVLLRENQYEQAREYFTTVAQNSTTESGAEAQYLIGESYQSQGDRERALEAYGRVGVLFQAYVEWVAQSQYKTAEIYIREGRRGEAISLLNSISETHPDPPAARRASRLLQQN